MPVWLEQWNRRLAKWLWWVVLIGVLGSLPVAYARVQTENSADNVEIIVDYKDILTIAATQADPKAFADEQIKKLKDAGVNAMAVFESNLDELSMTGDVTVYSAAQAAQLAGQLSAPGDNRTYVLFNKPDTESALRPIVENAFEQAGISVAPWSVLGRDGVVLGIGPEDAKLRPMEPNPIFMQVIHDAGLMVVPRISDRILPYDAARVADWLAKFKAVGATRILFDGSAVTGFTNHVEAQSLNDFAKQLKDNGIGIAVIENLKAPQSGMNGLAQRLDYDAVRLHSVSEGEMMVISPETLKDRLVLAVKDRNIRMIYLNAAPARDDKRAQVTHPIDKTIVPALSGADGAIERMRDFGFQTGEAHAFKVHHAPAETLWRALAIAGSVALIAILIGLFLPPILLPVTILGFIGGAGVLALDASLLNQALALFVAIAAPTVSVVTLVRLLRARRSRPENFRMSAGKRLGSAVALYIRTAILSVIAIPFVIALLNHITYELVLQQFRGVSLLHLAPIALVALYVFFYGSASGFWGNIRQLLVMPIKVFWVVVGVFVLAAGYYYLTRTGNGGSASGLEMKLRTFLETTFHVRPRFKEFAMGHPLMLLGLFLSLRYPKWPLVLIVAATIGQLSMVDTFAHIHTPAVLSATRDLLGLGIGFLIGLVLIVVWQVLERLWAAWRRQLATK
ncbi:DUF5693 family protein [Cohnella sp. JJ-181]|uniref:DUF5693 family protein n=1 Tax=Cohnella rhizoplanae TaxID=2974897 RepID=UPI0022FF5693|nr:DUF5693 family protein [Cohnella sp. JJ-181]CAI6081991.1 hypothetical protein COHCIP112018_03497 [Cohnella sp. JJ-181]